MVFQKWKHVWLCFFIYLSTRCSLLYFIWGYLGCWEQPWFVALGNGGNMFGTNEISISSSCSYRWGACFLSGQPGNPIINLSFADGLCCIMPFIVILTMVIVGFTTVLSAVPVRGSSCAATRSRARHGLWENLGSLIWQGASFSPPVASG
jgi:hypothetical protein